VISYRFISLRITLLIISVSFTEGLLYDFYYKILIPQSIVLFTLKICTVFAVASNFVCITCIVQKCCRARFSSVISKLYSLCKFLLAISVGISLKTIYDSPVKCSCPTVCEHQGTRSFEQQIFESNLHTQLHEPFRPVDVSEVIQHKFFNASIIADFQQSNPISSLQRIDKLDIADMVSQVTALLGSSGHSHWRITRLENGYRRLDLVRGIEYIIDASISLIENQTTEYRKLHLVRPFGAMHLLSNNIFDNTKLVHFIVAVPGLTLNLHRFLSNFEDVCARKNDRAYLLIVVCSDSVKEMEAVRSAANVIQHRHHDTVHVRVVHTRRRFDLALALDLGSRQLPGSALIAFTDIDIRFSRAAVRRCQLHAIENHQVYYPVVFSQYDPDVVRRFSLPGIVDNPDIISQHTGQLYEMNALLEWLFIQESCVIAKMTARCTDKSKRTATPPPKIT